ncbi:MULTISPECIES: XTP/dITP diphosphatase [Clostridium]|uniref:XTP/dITP diphosphatase n=1 Tax=Clostridium TaxID=1485 RepID=UPI00069CE22C|nr:MULTISPECIES: XTP/dITP diphosphatase [Clostridium]KOF58102.1 nucleoside-triphosphate diphosphatase [Clostridium sp. DMHC 10]MCD2347747.1 XTP/dITP diphosphatase [Clostridium guangxiense]
MKNLIIASNNKDKIREIKEILKKYKLNIMSQSEAGVNIEVEEDGTSFMENAYKKAHEIYELKKDSIVIADDSGLMVDILDGAPGIYSARFAGEHGNSEKNNEKLLKLLEGVPFEKRKAKFVCAIILIVNDNHDIRAQGEVEGYITEEARGKDGFGYDPLFYIPQYNKTFAEITADEKNNISHRAIALKKLSEEISKLPWE